MYVFHCFFFRLLRSFDPYREDRDCALTLGLVQMLIQNAILKLPEESASMQEKLDAVAALCKVRWCSLGSFLHLRLSQVIWIQNDLFSRHYIDE